MGLVGMVAALSILMVEAFWTDTREEESYRNDAAIHMMETGNYSVPHQFGHRYLYKPPGTNWLIALASIPFGTVTDVSGRIPILLLYLLMPLTIYALIQERFSMTASVTAAVASVLYLPWFVEKGPIMELDLLFSYFTVCAQAAWFYYHDRDHHYTKWILSHLFIAAAFMVKGPVAFLFVYVTITVYQLWLSEHPFHFPGLFVGLIIFLLPTGAWFVSTLSQVSLTEWWQVTLSQMSGPAVRNNEIWGMMYHYISYPVETIGSFFPWIVFLIPLFSGSFRERWFKLWDERPIIGYSVAALPVWFAFYPLPGSDIRYILPIYPWLAIIAGSVLDLPSSVLDEHHQWATGLRRFLGIVFLLLAAALPFILQKEPGHPASVLALSMIGFAVVTILILRFDFNSAPYRNLIGCALVSILTIKAGYLFIYAPVEKPKWFVRKEYASRVADYLEQHNIQPCLSTGQRVYYYLHQRYKGISNCHSSPESSAPSNWKLDKRQPENQEVQIRKTFSHPRLGTLYLYRSS